MTNLDELFEGIEVEMDGNKPIGKVPEKLVDRLDLVYSLGGGGLEVGYVYSGVDLEHSKLSVNNVEIITRKILTLRGNAVRVIVGSWENDPLKNESIVTRRTSMEDDTLQRLYLFGAVKSVFQDHVMTPVLCLDKLPEGVRCEQANLIRYQGMVPVGFDRQGLLLKINANEWKGGIDVNDNGNTNTYVGANNNLESVKFDELISFDLNKVLFYARSPNESVKLNSLASVNITENGKEVEYSLVYDNPSELRQDGHSAVNSGGEVGWQKSFFLGMEYMNYLNQ
jgi:hypothetical protein